MTVMPADPLRASAELICAQLCCVAAGDLNVCLNVASDDLTAQKLVMLGNAVLHVARRAVATAEAKGRELVEAHKLARLGTWRMNLTAGARNWNWSSEMRQLFGVDARFIPTDEVCRNLIHPADRARVAAAHERAAAGLVEAYEWRARCPDGIERRIWSELRPEREGDAIVAIRGVCQDVTERRTAEARIRHLAEHDVLTGLANRAVLLDRLGKTLAHRHRRRGVPATVAVLCVDLDGFKTVNDRYGHAAGDRILVQAADRMRALVRGSNTLARLGGDEFAIIQVAEKQPLGAKALAERLVEMLGQPYDLGESTQATITASVGVALSPGDADAVDALLAAADTAMYRAKSAGRNGVALYHPEMERELREQRALRMDLHCAAERGEMALVYQPLVDVTNGDVLGFEALLRWQHPTRGLVLPDLFISLAEASGAILSIGDWVLEQACAEAARWADPLFVAVNVSPVQVQRGSAFADVVERVLARTGLAPERLELEVTESVLICEADAALSVLRRVRALGVRVALDDFGTGYSSLATLQAFPFDKIKIDRRFVKGIGGGSAQDAAIVRAVLGLARGLGVPVVAEGVETSVQLDALRAEHCAEAQGWLFGRPGPVPKRLLSLVDQRRCPAQSDYECSTRHSANQHRNPPLICSGMPVRA